MCGVFAPRVVKNVRDDNLFSGRELFQSFNFVDLERNMEKIFLSGTLCTKKAAHLAANPVRKRALP
jgi:hypothetical protein